MYKNGRVQPLVLQLKKREPQRAHIPPPLPGWGSYLIGEDVAVSHQMAEKSL